MANAGLSTGYRTLNLAEQTSRLADEIAHEEAPVTMNALRTLCTHQSSSFLPRFFRRRSFDPRSSPNT